MAFDAEGFLTLAESLFGASESEERTAIGRLYYGLFLRARTHAGLAHIKDASVHRLTMMFLRTSPTSAPAAEALNALRTLRNFCDYEVDENLTLAHVDEAKRHANDVQEIMGGIW